jgi:hypothetical protein
VVSVVQRSKDAEVGHLRQLKENWDGRGALVPTRESIDLLEVHLAGLRGLQEGNHLLFNLKVVPDADGLAVIILTPRGNTPCAVERITVCFDGDTNSALVASTDSITQLTSISEFALTGGDSVAQLHRYLVSLR